MVNDSVTREAIGREQMRTKTLQYLMGHSDISVTMNVYTHISFDDAEKELKQMEEFGKAQAEIEKRTMHRRYRRKCLKLCDGKILTKGLRPI